MIKPHRGELNLKHRLGDCGEMIDVATGNEIAFPQNPGYLLHTVHSTIFDSHRGCRRVRDRSCWRDLGGKFLSFGSEYEFFVLDRWEGWEVANEVIDQRILHFILGLRVCLLDRKVNRFTHFIPLK